VTVGADDTVTFYHFQLRPPTVVVFLRAADARWWPL
jgi:hypothetical protein